MFLELLEVFVLLLKLLLELKELLLLPHSDGIVLAGFLALCECISVQGKRLVHSPGGGEQQQRTLMLGLLLVELQYHLRPWLELL
jgi:hypothetical protein